MTALLATEIPTIQYIFFGKNLLLRWGGWLKSLMFGQSHLAMEVSTQ